MRALTALLIVAAVATVPPAAAAAEKGTLRSDSKLSAKLQELSSPPLANASNAEQAAAVDVPTRGAGSLLRHGKRLVVSARVTRLDGIKKDFRSAGASVLASHPEYKRVTVVIAAPNLDRLAAIESVESVAEELEPATSQAGTAAAYDPCAGAATSEGDDQLQAETARQRFGLSGQGVEVGILSDSYEVTNGDATDAADDIVSGDIPGSANPCGRIASVQVVDEIDNPSGAIDEGRGMAQIVHDLAPDARIAFATAFDGLLEFARNIRRLHNAGSDVIVDDVFYFVEPMFQPGPVDASINYATVRGSTYYTAAGNSNVILAGNNVASWETPSFRGSGSCPAGAPSYATDCLDFDPGTGVDTGFAVTVPPHGGFLLDLQWAEPWNGVETDIDAYVLSSNNMVVAASEDFNFTSQTPFELLEYVNPSGTTRTVRIAVNRFDGADSPRLKFVLVGADISASDYPASAGGDVVGPTIFGHAAARNAMSVGAIRYNAVSAPEPYSSRGPATHYFGTVRGTTPAPTITPQVQEKPDLVATDGGANTFFGSLSDGIWRFFGTSAAAPHAAAVAALQLEGNPSMGTNDVKRDQRATADPVGSFGPDAVGHGIVNAFRATSRAVPRVTISDRTLVEGDSGTKAMRFTVTLDRRSDAVVSVDYSTRAGTADTTDFEPVFDQLLRFQPGVTARSATVQLTGDTTPEPDEQYEVVLGNPVRVGIADRVAAGTIFDDD